MTIDPNEVLAALENKRRSVTEHYEKLASERAAIAFAAHGEGDEAARRRLDQINQDAVKIDGELSSIDSAIAVAKQKVEQAQSAERTAEARAKAAEAEANYRWLVEHGPQLSHHAEALAALLAEAKRKIDANHQLGFAFPSAMQFISAMTRATSAMIMRFPIKNFEHEFLPPHQRFDYGKVLEDWGNTGLRSTEQKGKANAAA